MKTLHEANEQLDADEQHTILDGLKLLSDDKYRKGVLANVSDSFLLEWWERDFGGWRREYRSEALAPVQTRLSYYASSKRARAILGQRRSTIDLRCTILDGGILLVSTAQGTAGRDVAALVGASILNLVDAVIREQGDLPPEQRRGALVVVDEMQSMPGVNYESMLSELGKFSASFVLATQSLDKLEDLSRTMRTTLLANVGCLAVFQVAGSDARQLVWELDRDRISEEDIVSLPVHHLLRARHRGLRAHARLLDGGAQAGRGRSRQGRPHPRRPPRATSPPPANSAPPSWSRARRWGNSTRACRRSTRGLRRPQRPARPSAPLARSRDAARRRRSDPVSTATDATLLRRLGSMPFLDRLELAAAAGIPDRSAYHAVAALERRGLVVSYPTAPTCCAARAATP